MTTRTSRFLWGVGLNYLNFAVMTAVGLWLTRFVLGQVGAEAMGLWVQLFQLVGYLNLLDLGILVLLPREVAAATGRAGGSGAAAAGDLPVVIGRSARLVIVQTPLVAAVAAVAWVMVRALEEAAAGPLGVALAGYVVLFPLRVGGAVLAGLQDTRAMGLIQLAGFAAGTATTVGLAVAGGGLYALSVGWIANNVTTSGLHWVRLLTGFPTVLPSRLPAVPFAEARSLWGIGAWASLASLGNTLVANTDALAIGRFHPAASVLAYVFTAKLTAVLAPQATGLCAAALPGLAEVRAAGDPVRTARVLAAYAQAIMLLSGWLGCLILMVNSGFVRWWVGPGYDLGPVTVALLVAGMVVRHWGNCQAIALFVAGWERRLWVATLAEGLTTAAAIVALAAWAGPGWVPAATLVGACGVFLPIVLTAGPGAGIFPLRSQIRAVGWCAIRAAAVGVGVVSIRQVWHPNGLLELTAAGIGVSVVYAAVMAVPVLRREVGVYLRPRRSVGVPAPTTARP